MPLINGKQFPYTKKGKAAAKKAAAKKNSTKKGSTKKGKK
jgi:hypothetical protein